MKELLNRLIALHKSGEKMQETTLLKTNEQNVTPEWIEHLNSAGHKNGKTIPDRNISICRVYKYIEPIP